MSPLSPAKQNNHHRRKYISPVLSSVQGLGTLRTLICVCSHFCVLVCIWREYLQSNLVCTSRILPKGAKENKEKSLLPTRLCWPSIPSRPAPRMHSCSTRHPWGLDTLTCEKSVLVTQLQKGSLPFVSGEDAECQPSSVCHSETNFLFQNLDHSGGNSKMCNFYLN